MAAPTSISVAIDLDEYSKFEDDRNTITVTWTATSGSSMAGETLTLKLIKARRLRDAVVKTITITISGSSTTETGEETIFLPEVVDSDYINLIRRGLYFIRVESDTTPAVYGDTADFHISIITVKALRETYLFGLELKANDVRMVKFQPQRITGVEVESMSQNHPMVFAPLTYIYKPGTPAIRQISWGAGPLVSITAPGQYLLRFDCTGAHYMVIRIRSLSALPTTSVTEELLVEKDIMDDLMLRRWINQACDWWENDKVTVFLEPTKLVTDTDPTLNADTDWDFIVPPITFYPITPAKWIDILFPYPSLLRMDQLFGQIANTRIVDIDLSWLEISEKNGFAQLVPFNQEAAFRFIGLVWVESIRGVIELPNFWHFNCVAGMREVDPVVLEILAKKAGIDALTIAGQAFRGGFSSQSISRDGVSESVSYTASAIYGIYSATIEDFNKFINREIKSLRSRYRGFNLMVV